MKESISLPIFKEDSMEYTDVYLTRLTENINSGSIPVWHTIKLLNNSQMPWTTGSVVVSKDGHFSAYNNLPYTGIGDTAFVSLAQSLDTKLNFRKDTQRVPELDTKGVRVSMTKITCLLLNTKPHPVTFIVLKSFTGVPTETTKPVNITVHSTQYLNNLSTVKWEIALLPNESKELYHSYLSYQQEP